MKTVMRKVRVGPRAAWEYQEEEFPFPFPESVEEAIEYLGEEKLLDMLGCGLSMIYYTRLRMVLKEGGTAEQALKYLQAWDPKAPPKNLKTLISWQQELEEGEEE